MNNSGLNSLAIFFALLLFCSYAVAQQSTSETGGSQTDNTGQQATGGTPVDDSIQAPESTAAPANDTLRPDDTGTSQAGGGNAQQAEENESAAACPLAESKIEDKLLPARYVTIDGELQLKQQKEFFKSIGQCIEAPLPGDDAARKNRIRDKIVLFTDIRELLERRSADIKAAADLEGVDKAPLELLGNSFQDEIEKLDDALFALYNQLHTLESLRALSGDEAIAECRDGFSGSVDFKVSELPNPDDLKNYLKICREAFESAVQTNDADALAALRDAAQASIKDINTAMVIHIEAAGNGFKREAYREAQAAIDTLQRLQGQQSRLPLLANWQSDPFTYQFYTGVDISKVTGVDTNESVRLGLINYFRPGRQLQKLRERVPNCNGDQLYCGEMGLYFPHAYMALNIASEEEQEPGESEPSIEWEGGLFVPVYIGRRGFDSENITEIVFGPIFTRGGAQVGDTDDSRERKYRGFRLALNEETYFDGLYGKSDEYQGRRYVVRGQFPFTKLGGGRVFFGWDINFSAEGGGDPDDRDVIGFYAIWQTSFDDLWRSRTSGD